MNVDSWRRTMQKINKNGNHEKVPLNAILKLNDDCLLHIFSFLPLSDKFKMSILSKRFENIFQLSLRKVLNINDPTKPPDKLTLDDVRHILIQYGDSIEHILFDNQNFYFEEGDCYRFMTYIPQYCPNLKKLKLKHVKNLSKTIKPFTNLKLINKVELKHCNVDDKTLFYLLQLPEIVSLDLTYSRALTGKYLNKFRKLQTLSLRNCRLNHLVIVGICKTLKLLRELSLEVFNEEILDVIIKNMKNMEQLIVRLPNPTNMHKIADIQNLKILSLKAITLTENYDLTHLMKKLAIKNTLETLCIIEDEFTAETLRLIPTIRSIKKIIITSGQVDSGFLENCAKCNFLQYLCLRDCYEFENSDIVNLIKQSKSLQTLHLELYPFGNEHTSESIISDIVELMNEEKRCKPFKLIVPRMEKSEQIRHQNLIPSNLSEILELSFDSPNYYGFF